MKAAAVVLTYGRASVCELLAMLARQTVRLPVLVWVDDVPQLELDELPALVELEHGPRFERRDSIGLVRAAAVESARARFGLGPEDALLTLDDDDFYSPRHFELTLRALERCDWTGGLDIGLDWRPGQLPTYCSAERGVGQHATWAMRMRAYDAGGGYRDEKHEDMNLAWRLGFNTCRPHHYLTHVRTQHDHNLSALFDREHVRLGDARIIHGRPTWTDRCERFARWCESRLYV